MTEEDEEFNRIEREAKQRTEAVSAALDKKSENARELGLDYGPVWGGGSTNKDYEDAMRLKRLNELSKPAQPMHPEIKKMYEDYFDKCFRESSAAVPENFMDALKFDVAMRERVMEPAQPINQDFNDWWDEDVLTEDNPFNGGTPAYWAWEGWCAGVKAEREACAKVCETTAPSQINGYECAAAIRARSDT